MNVPYNSPGGLHSFLEEHGLALSKRFGQNFLLNPALREAVVKLLNISEGLRVWEIGPGLGALTSLILERGARLTAFEVDRGFSEVLRNTFSKACSFKLVEGDFLKTWKKETEEYGAPDRIIGNLPYSAASQIIANLLEEGLFKAPMVFTVQKELALRMLAKPGTKDYSSFSVLCQTFATIKRCFDIQPGSFFPKPEVISTTISLTPGLSRVFKDREFYLCFVRAIFSSRRKTLVNNASAAYGLSGHLKERTAEMLVSMGIDPNARGETLTVEQIVDCADNMRNIIKYT